MWMARKFMRVGAFGDGRGRGQPYGDPQNISSGLDQRQAPRPGLLCDLRLDLPGSRIRERVWLHLSASDLIQPSLTTYMTHTYRIYIYI